MLRTLPGHKVGMTQLFDEQQRVVPVTVIEFSGWYVTQIKTTEKDGYNAIQVARARKRYRNEAIADGWLKKKAHFFGTLREIRFNNADEMSAYTLGQALSGKDIVLDAGVKVSVSGRSRGKGFQGVVKRWHFSGGPKSHGSKFHRIPGSSSHMRRQGEVIKGKRFPGHAGDRNVTVSGLTVVKVDQERGVIFVKGAVPGKSGSLLFIRKQG